MSLRKSKLYERYVKTLLISPIIYKQFENGIFPISNLLEAWILFHDLTSQSLLV